MYDRFFKRPKLKKRMSMHYQYMVIFMEEHLLARIEKSKYGHVIDDIHVYSEDELYNFFKNKIKKRLTNNHLNYIERNSFKDSLKDSLIVNDDYYNAYYNDNYFIFQMKAKGYSYQYNGYQKADQKLTKTANFFIGVTTIYYIVSWMFTFSQVKDFFSKTFILSKVTLFFKNFMISILNYPARVFSAILLIIFFRLLKKYIIDPIFLE